MYSDQVDQKAENVTENNSVLKKYCHHIFLKKKLARYLRQSDYERKKSQEGGGAQLKNLVQVDQ